MIHKFNVFFYCRTFELYTKNKFCHIIYYLRMRSRKRSKIIRQVLSSMKKIYEKPDVNIECFHTIMELFYINLKKRKCY